jgi:hypothetical protein
VRKNKDVAFYEMAGIVERYVKKNQGTLDLSEGVTREIFLAAVMELVKCGKKTEYESILTYIWSRGGFSCSSSKLNIALDTSTYHDVSKKKFKLVVEGNCIAGGNYMWRYTRDGERVDGTPNIKIERSPDKLVQKILEAVNEKLKESAARKEQRKRPFWDRIISAAQL